MFGCGRRIEDVGRLQSICGLVLLGLSPAKEKKDLVRPPPKAMQRCYRLTSCRDFYPDPFLVKVKASLLESAQYHLPNARLVCDPDTDKTIRAQTTMHYGKHAEKRIFPLIIDSLICPCVPYRPILPRWIHENEVEKSWQNIVHGRRKQRARSSDIREEESRAWRYFILMAINHKARTYTERIRNNAVCYVFDGWKVIRDRR